MGSILGIDPGTHCGWAVRGTNGEMTAGVWQLKGGRHEGGGMRFVRLRLYLRQVLLAHDIDMVFYEEVRRHKGVDAAHIYGGIIAVISSLCEEDEIPYAGIPVGRIKQQATSKGNANKEAMVAAAEAQWPDAVIEDDNEADARWIAETGFFLYVSEEKTAPAKASKSVEEVSFL
ncbi:MAG: hypothetical protein ABFD89_22685 [Bryobacteraceae bacterium]